MPSNNYILFTFGLVFLLVATFDPIINEEFNQEFGEIDIEDEIAELGQEDFTLWDSLTNVITESKWGSFFFTLFFFPVSAPFYINIIIILMKAVFLVILWDKIRGI